MKISELVEVLERTKREAGDIECVVEIEDFRGDSIFTTVEDVVVRRWKHGKRAEDAAHIDWRR